MSKTEVRQREKGRDKETLECERQQRKNEGRELRSRLCVRTVELVPERVAELTRRSLHADDSICDHGHPQNSEPARCLDKR